MPTYSFRCSSPACGAQADRLLALDDRDLLQRCLVCGEPMTREVAATRGPFPGADRWRTVTRSHGEGL